MKLKISVVAKNVVITALRLYVGEYPWAYKGADYWAEEAKELIKRISDLDCTELCCGWHLMMNSIEFSELEISEGEKNALRCSLGLYTGEYVDYEGADLWDDLAKRFVLVISTNYREIRLFA